MASAATLTSTTATALSSRAQTVILALLAAYLAGTACIAMAGVQRAQQCARRRRRMQVTIDAYQYADPPRNLRDVRKQAGCEALLLVDDTECTVQASDGMSFRRGDVLRHARGGEGDHREERPFHVVLEKAARGGGYVALRLLDKVRDEKRMAVMYATAVTQSRALIGIIWDHP